MKFDFQTIKNKYFIDSDSKIAIASTDEIKSLILTLEDQAETLDLYKKELNKAKEEYTTLYQSIAESDAIIEQYREKVRELKNNASNQSYWKIAKDNLKLAKENVALKEQLAKYENSFV